MSFLRRYNPMQLVLKDGVLYVLAEKILEDATSDAVLAGDVTGSLGAAAVVALRGRPLGNAAPSVGDLLAWDGSAWVPLALDLGAEAVGGDLSGTVDAATVVGLRGRPVGSAAPSSGQFLAWSGSAWVPTDVPAAPAETYARTFDVSYSFAGAAHDYTLDAEWNSTVYTVSQGTVSTTGPLGGTATVPTFFAYNKSTFAANGLTLTGSGALRMTILGTAGGTLIGPPDGTGAPGIWFPLPRAEILGVEFVLSTNAGTTFNSHGVLASIVSFEANDASPRRVVSARFQGNLNGSTQEYKEYVDPWDGFNLPAATPNGVGARAYRLTWDGPGTAGYSGLVGGTLFLARGVNHGLRAWSKPGIASAFSVSLYSNAANSAWYGELSALRVYGTRARI